MMAYSKLLHSLHEIQLHNQSEFRNDFSLFNTDYLVIMAYSKRKKNIVCCKKTLYS